MIGERIPVSFRACRRINGGRSPELHDVMGVEFFALANETGIPLTTVHSWKRSKYVPEWRRGALIGVAEKQGKRLSLADFPTERPTESRDAA